VQLAGSWRREGGARVSDRKIHLTARRNARLDDMEKDDDSGKLCNDDVILNAAQLHLHLHLRCSADSARPG
jgi:hypothetical protein